MKILKTPILWLATGFGLGHMPVASGTFGSLLGIPIVLAMQPLHWLWQAVLAATLTLLAIPICGVAERTFKTKDDGRIVADEWMILPISFIGLPLSEAWLLLPVYWIFTRVFDILKPPPANSLQRLPGGLGIVIDDFFAALYALAANHLLFYLFGLTFG